MAGAAPLENEWVIHAQNETHWGMFVLGHVTLRTAMSWIDSNFFEKAEAGGTDRL